MADPLYMAARRALLDALEAMGPHLEAITLVGAQAVYLHTGEADLAVAPFTTDGDLALDPARLGRTPLIEEALSRAEFRKEPAVVGIWQRTVDVERTPRIVTVDLLVPASLGGPGRRGARIPPHDRTVARKVVGLEGALVDREVREIGALQEADARTFRVGVAGPAALLVAKLHKIDERQDTADRLGDKDALDVFRLLRAIPTEVLASRWRLLLADPISKAPADSSVDKLAELFGTRSALGTQMVVRATAPLEDPDVVTASSIALAEDLLRAL